MKEIYRIKEGTSLPDLYVLEDYGFEINPVMEVITKVVKQPLEGEAVQFLLNNLYNNLDWKKKFYNSNKKMFKKECNLKYDKNQQLILNDETKEFLSTWYCVIELDDGWVGFTHCDKHNQMVYYGAKVIEKYCPSELFNLLATNLIEKVEIEEE